MISLEDGKQLVGLAKEAVKSQFSGNKPNVDKIMQRKFSVKQGAFVTLNKSGVLRGCIGFTDPIYPLWDTIIKAANSAAFSDPRFPPLEEEELGDVSFEISVLTVPELIKVETADEYPSRVKIGQDGLIIKSRMGSGLLLPQVFTEYKVNSLQALDMTCQKAGLPPGIWKSDECEVYKFQAQIFSEEGEEVVLKKG